MRAQTPNIPVSSIIASGELSLEERRRFRLNAVQALIDRAINVKKIGANLREIVVRDVLPQLDLAVAVVGAGAASQTWIVDVAITGPAAAAPDNWINAALPAQRAMVVFGVFSEDPSPIITHVFFRVGPAPGNTRAIAHLQRLYSMLEPTGYLTKAVLWDPLETVRVDIQGRLAVAADTELLGLLGYIAEPTGELISGPVV